MDALAVGTISTALKQAREQHGISLQDVSQAVNVPLPYLQALEGEGDRRFLADTMYLIPFLRTYASYLGFNHNGAVRQFISELQSSEIAKVKTPLESPLSPARFSAWILPLVVLLGGLLSVAFVIRSSELGTWWPFGQQEEISSAVFSPTDFAAPVAEEDALQEAEAEDVRGNRAEEQEGEGLEDPEFALATVQDRENDGENPESAALQPEAVTEGQAPAPALPSALPAIASSAPLLPASQILQVPSGLHQLHVYAVEKTWLRVVIDGEQTQDMMLNPDQQMHWEARDNFTLTVGNAGGIEVALDGNPLPPLGRPGEVVRRVRIPSAE
jgi:cytoskeleton protein RodZ